MHWKWRSVFCCSTQRGFSVSNNNGFKMGDTDTTVPLVTTAQGILQGAHCEDIEKYIAFKGIPYAKPPVGKLRFKAPEPSDPWSGIRIASQHGPVCPQYNERMDCIETGSEDCLYLNVYTKTITPSSPLPVMVWIHGGGFYTGSGNSDFYGPDFIVAHDVVLVTFNYRLEVLGFLCLDTEEVPGNAGLKDQVMALKWVRSNIAVFGGDPDNITIFGCSAGAASTAHHITSKMSEGLFHKAICQSGVSINEWAYSNYGRDRAFQLGKLLGKHTNDPNDLLDFLRDVPIPSLVNIQLPPLDNIIHKDITDSIMFGPVIESPSLNTEKFLSEPPPDSVIKGNLTKVPVILGYTSGEGIELARKLQYIIDFVSTTGSVVPREIKLQTSAELIKEADEKIRAHYFGSKNITKDSLQEYANLETDKLFAFNIVRYARYFSIRSPMPVYLYKFIAESERNFTKKKYKMETLDGVCHADDLPYQFHVTNVEVPLTDDSKCIIKKFTRLWTDFAKTGNPTPSSDTDQWLPFTDAARNCYVIGNNLKCDRDVDEANIKFWESIYGEKL